MKDDDGKAFYASFAAGARLSPSFMRKPLSSLILMARRLPPNIFRSLAARHIIGLQGAGRLARYAVFEAAMFRR